MALILIGLTSNASAIDLESLVLPGELIQGHEELESDCDQCHVSFAKDRQSTLCRDCHEDVSADIQSGIGFHGRFPDARTSECSSCHTDHEGRGADIIGFVPDSFDHDLSDFRLVDAHTEVECKDCHVPTEKFREAPTECVDCHEDDDEHEGSLGPECDRCHQATEWIDTKFDHEGETDYALIGQHAETTCAGCHADNQFEDTPTDCYACHREEDEHQGLNGKSCGDCHTPYDWAKTEFDHSLATDFSLLGSHKELQCEDCHKEPVFDVALQTDCYACHAKDDVHEGRLGEDCSKCHNDINWSELAQFDHDLTDFPLRGGHKDLQCEDCHTEPAVKVPLETDCYACHAEDDVHEGQLGEVCGNCHSDTEWTDQVRFDHDLTVFPLIGIHGETECEGCHESQKYLDAAEQCIDCHKEDDVHEERLGLACDDCHNPNGWPFWIFDHDLRTDFVLDGAHADLGCRDCHSEPVTGQIELSSRCASCHREDDVHQGEFGADCERCHSTDTFETAERIR